MPSGVILYHFVLFLSVFFCTSFSHYVYLYGLLDVLRVIGLQSCCSLRGHFRLFKPCFKITLSNFVVLRHFFEVISTSTVVLSLFCGVSVAFIHLFLSMSVQFKCTYRLSQGWTKMNSDLEGSYKPADSAWSAANGHFVCLPSAEANINWKHDVTRLETVITTAPLAGTCPVHSWLQSHWYWHVRLFNSLAICLPFLHLLECTRSDTDSPQRALVQWSQGTWPEKH